MHSLHADDVSITDPRTLKMSTIVIFEYLHGAFPTVFFLLRVDTWKALDCSRKLFRAHPVCQYCAETNKITCSASVIFVPFFNDLWFLQELDQWDYLNSVHSHFEGITLRCAFGRCQNHVIDI